MHKAEAKVDNVTFGEFEDFALEGDSVVARKKRLYGKFKNIRAHAPAPGITVVYREIRDVEILCDKRKTGRGKNPVPIYAVSFHAAYEIRDGAGKLRIAQGTQEPGSTKVSYWNFTEKDFQTLQFLRDRADRLLFIRGVKQPAYLLAIAARHFEADSTLEQVAYERALAILPASAGDDAAWAAYREYIALLLKAARPPAGVLIADYRKLDAYGVGGAALAQLMLGYDRPAAEVEAVLCEAVERLTRLKPKAYAVELEKILGIVAHEGFAALPADKLLWQTYLAASAERDLVVLKRLLGRALRLKADKETLVLIHNTWRGFAGPRAARLGHKEARQITKRI